MKRKLLFLFVMLLTLSGTAQTMQQSTTLIDENTEFSAPPLQNVNFQTDAISIWSLPSTGATSGNTRCPGNTFRYQRTSYLITAAEMAASGFPSGNEINSIGFLIGTAGVGTQTGTFTVYLRNTTDATYSLGTTWDISAFTKVSEIANWTVPIAAGSYEVPFSGGSSFTYNGGGVYVAWEFSNPAGTLGTTALVALCNLNLSSGLMGQRSSTAMPTTLAASNWRPATIFGNNFYTDIIQVSNIYTNERNPIPFGLPTPVDVRVTNVSATPQNFDLTLTIKDAATSTTRFTTTQPVALGANTSSIVSFTGWNPSIQENVNISTSTSAVAGENWTINNTLSIPGNVNDNLYSYTYTTSGSSGFGYTYPNTGIFATKFKMNNQGKVTGANLLIANFAANTGNTVYAVVLNSVGAIVAQSADYVIVAGDLGNMKSFTFPTPPVFTDEDFYIGIAQTAGTVQWYPIGTLNESPRRLGKYYETTITGGTLTELATNWNLKFGMEAVVAPNFSLPTITTVAASGITSTLATVNGTAMANNNNVSVTFEYGLTTSYGSTATGTPATVSGTNVTSFSSNLTGLTPLTTYHYRAVGTISGVFKYYGADMTFTTTAPPPTVVTTAATAVGNSDATLNGTVNANTASSTVTFEWGLTTAYGTTVSATPNTVNGSTTTPVSASIAGLTINTTYHFRVKAVSSGGTSYGDDKTFLTGCSVPATPGTISGPVSVCQGASGVVYSVAPVLNADTYIWTLPTGGTITSGDGTNSIIVAYSASASSGNVTVKGNNACGDGNTNSLAVTLNPAPVPALTAGPLSVCAGTTGVIYSTVSGMTGYTWTISSGGSITAGAGTNSITVNWNTVGPQTISLNYTNGSGCSAASPSVFNIGVVARPVPTISGPAAACKGFANVYTTETGMSSYNWTVSAGGSITAGAGTNSITVVWNTLGAKNVGVNYTIPAGCNATTPTTYAVTVNPTTTPTITGDDVLCAGSNDVVYTTEGGFSNYNWYVSYGGVITSGLNTNEVTVNWSTAGARTITTNYSNSLGCAALNPPVLNVTVNPTAVPVVAGPTEVCQGSTGNVYTTQPLFTDYEWVLSSGGTITSGAGTNSITVTWNTAGNHTVSSAYTNDFGCHSITPTVLNVTAAPLPNASGTIAGTTPVCAGATDVMYTVAPITNADTYNWTLPAGATIASGTGTRTIRVNFATNASSGIIKVSGNNDCGAGASSPNFNLVVNPLPVTPVITQVGDTLKSSAASGNQWYLGGVIILGATNQTYVPTQNGSYTVIVTNNACSSSPSNAIVLLNVSVDDVKVGQLLEVYPNPNHGQFNIKVVTTKPLVADIEIYNNIGSLRWKQEKVTIDGVYITPVDIQMVPAGVYMVSIRNKNINVVRKVIVLK